MSNFLANRVNMSDPELLDSTQFVKLLQCPICDAKNHALIGSRNSIHPEHSDVSFSIRQCCGCGHWSTDPVPLQNYLTKLYAAASPSVVGDENSKSVTGEFLTNQKKINRKDLKKFNWILKAARQCNPKTYLEIGIGNGLLLEYFRESGLRCAAVEPGGWTRGTADIY